MSYELNEDGEWAEWLILSRRFYKARKQHMCDNCRSPIEPGQQYSRTFSVFGGKPETHRSHMGGGCSNQRVFNALMDGTPL